MFAELVATMRGILPGYVDFGAKPVIFLVAVVVIVLLWRSVRP